MRRSDTGMYKIANKAKLRTLNLLKDLYDFSTAESGINALRGGKAPSVAKGHIDLSLPMHERYGYDTPESLLDGWRRTKQHNSSSFVAPKTRAEENMENYTASYRSKPSFSTFNAQRPQRRVRESYGSLKNGKEYREAFSNQGTAGRSWTDTSYASQLSDYVTKSINNNPELQRLFRNLKSYKAKDNLAKEFGIYYTPREGVIEQDDIYRKVPLFTNRKLQREFKKYNQSPGLLSGVFPELLNDDFAVDTGKIFLPVVQRYDATKPFGTTPHIMNPTTSLHVTDSVDAAADAIKREGGVVNNKTIEQRVGKPFGTDVNVHTGEAYPADRRDTLAHTILTGDNPDYESVIRKGAEGNPIPGQKYAVDIPMTEWLFRRAGREDVLNRARIDLHTGQGDLDRTLLKGTPLTIPHKFYDDGSQSDFLNSVDEFGVPVHHIAPNRESAHEASLKLRENMPKEDLHDYLNLDWLPTWPKDTPLWLTPGAGNATGYALSKNYPFSKDLKWIPVDSKDIEDVLTRAGGPVSLDEILSTYPEQLQTNVRNILKNTLKARQRIVDTLPGDDRAVTEGVNALKSRLKSDRFPQQAMDLLQGNPSLFGQFERPKFGHDNWQLELERRLKG